MKRNGNAERRRRENRGAEGEVEGSRRRSRRGGGVWGGVSPSPPGKKFDFGSQYGEFWCILDGIFTVQLPVLHAKPEFNRYRRIEAVMVSR